MHRPGPRPTSPRRASQVVSGPFYPADHESLIAHRSLRYNGCRVLVLACVVHVREARDGWQMAGRAALMNRPVRRHDQFEPPCHIIPTPILPHSSGRGRKNPCRQLAGGEAITPVVAATFEWSRWPPSSSPSWAKSANRRRVEYMMLPDGSVGEEFRRQRGGSQQFDYFAEHSLLFPSRGDDDFSGVELSRAINGCATWTLY